MENDLELISKKIDALNERIRIYMTEETGNPSIGLLMSGVRSSLEEIIHHFRDDETKLDRAISTLNEMKALVGENTANLRALRNKFFCMGGDKEVFKEMEKINENKKAE